MSFGKRSYTGAPMAEVAAPSLAKAEAFGASLGRFLGVLILLGVVGAFVWAFVSGAWLAIVGVLVCVGLFGAVLRVAAWGLSGGK